MKIAVVVPYIGTWIETFGRMQVASLLLVVPYIGTWIETKDVVVMMKTF